MYTRILTTGGAVPHRTVTNDCFSNLFHGKNPDEWIYARTGIRKRRFTSESESTSDLATIAARNALDKSGLDPREIDCIILGTSTPDMILPASACVVQKHLGCGNAFAFDVNAVCSSLIFSLEIADNLIRSSKYKTILVIGADTYSKILDFNDPTTCPLFGDGAAAIILQATTERTGLLTSIVKSDGNDWKLIQVPSSGSRRPVSAETVIQRENTFKMEGKSVFSFACTVAPRIAGELIALAGVKRDEVDFVITHQANNRIIERVSEKTGIARGKFLTNLEQYGNTAAASIGLVLDENLRSGVIGAGALVMLIGFGGGLSWGGQLVKI
jgi:3-oxoacyl-[acyl-carrier-protein] synthase-3